MIFGIHYIGDNGFIYFIKEHKNFVLSIIVTIIVGCYIYQAEDSYSSCRVNLQTAESENHQLVHEKIELENSLTEQLQLINNTNQQLHYKNDKINTELQLVKGENQALFKKKEDLQKKIDQLNAELQLVKDNNQKLLEEEKKFQSRMNQINVELQSTKGNSQKTLEEKIKLLEKLHQMDNDREVYSTQVTYIQSWMGGIDMLEKHIYAVINCGESKKEGSKAESCSKVDYKFEENDTSVIVVSAIAMITKFKKECKPFWDALLLKKVDEMKAQQASTSLNEFRKKMEQINEEVSGYNYQKYKEEKAKEKTSQETDEHNKEKAKGQDLYGETHRVADLNFGEFRIVASQETGIAKVGPWSIVVTKFGMWVASMISRLFWS